MGKTLERIDAAIADLKKMGRGSDAHIRPIIDRLLDARQDYTEGCAVDGDDDVVEREPGRRQRFGVTPTG